ncbi:HEPN domain-containing protein [Desulfonatronum thiodismutans]|uniref:HEPN domain-containing protein n=1 Tax=Desulfonatronum thiodismutans TaxID=159290 RepID=UPI0004ABD7C9|nr:HEPN domain-containing protein [Desulfonatronum thiodismutans]
MMNKDKKVEYWIDISEYDLQTARAMLDSGRYIYVGFMCHQSIEKILKAHYQMIHEKTPPRTHNLSYLASQTALLSELPEFHADFLDELEPLNVQARYPEYKDLVKKRIDVNYAGIILEKTERLYIWIKNKLSH